MKLTSTLLLLAALLGLGGCDARKVTLAGGPWTYSELNRIKSPDRSFEAVLMAGEGGATTTRTTFLFVVPAGARVDPEDKNADHATFVADHIKNLSIRWKTSKMLEIGYEEARISHFQNISEQVDKEGSRYRWVELRLVPTKSDTSLAEFDRKDSGF